MRVGCSLSKAEKSLKNYVGTVEYITTVAQCLVKHFAGFTTAVELDTSHSKKVLVPPLGARGF